MGNGFAINAIFRKSEIMEAAQSTFIKVALFGLNVLALLLRSKHLKLWKEKNLGKKNNEYWFET